MTTVTWNESSLTHAIDQFVYDVCFDPDLSTRIQTNLNVHLSCLSANLSTTFHYAKSIEYFIQCKYWIDHFLCIQAV
jgi:hypothetical protein